ncbi:MAG: aromatic ring-hydroxylating dioxygenase subunit alpha [Alphaproteobacteria bacterium]
MLATQQNILRRFWYPVMPAESLLDGPQPFTLLGEDIVVWMGPDGEPAAATDRCCHRSAKLSRGWVEDGNIVCGYHGWTYDCTGTCIDVPQQMKSDRGTNFAIRTHNAATRYGYVWVCLDSEPLAEVPEIDEAEDPAYRLIPQFYEVWNCAGLRLMENSFDNAHVAFTHRKSFGMQNEPDPGEIELEETPGGLVMRSELEVANPDIGKKMLGTDSDRTVRTFTTTWFMPFVRRLRIQYPNGLIHVIVTCATPIDDKSSMVIQFAARSDTEADVPAADINAFDRQVTDEDRYILETTAYDVPLDLSAKSEAHMPSDRPGMMMRNKLRALLAEHGEAEATNAYPIGQAAE